MIKVGDRFNTNNGGDVVVVEYFNYHNIIVEFCDKYKYMVTTNGRNLKDGSIKNPYAPMLFRVGYFGIGPHKAKEDSSKLGYAITQSYRAWGNMLSRCYDSNYIDPSLYLNVIVDDEWHNYQNFAEWYTNQIERVPYTGRIYLDKDILTDESVYSEHNCCLVPNAVNLAVRKCNRGQLLQGVRRSKDGYRVIPNYPVSHLRYESEVDAHIAFVDAKINRIKEVALNYKEQIAPEVFDALIIRDFRHKFSPLFEPESRHMLK